jgi:probable addiction module antidote protein
MTRPYKKFRDYHMEKLRDAAEAKAYLELALADLHKEGDREGFLLALRDVAEAQGGVSHLLKKTELKPAGVYKALSEEGNPTLSTLDRILGGLGLRLSIEQAESVQTHH